MEDFTPNQRRAIDQEGNVLVLAGAGSGKTRTLVERCLARVLNPDKRLSLENILMVTFTEAAAAEMKSRIYERLQQEVSHSAPERSWLEEQLCILETAHIGTLHSFCLHLIRDHFHELGIDPQVSVLSEPESHLLMEETLDEVIRSYLESSTDLGRSVQQLISVGGGGREHLVRQLLVKLHDYTQTLTDPARWIETQFQDYQELYPSHWEQWYVEGVREWCSLWTPALRSQPLENKKAHEIATRLETCSPGASRQELAAMLREVVAADQDWPRGTNQKFRKPIEGFFDEAAFLDSQTAQAGEKDPLIEDWNWVRGPMDTLLKLTQQFGATYAQAKREQGAVDFHDLEQFALELLWERKQERATKLATQLGVKYELILVDEYQDINAAQDAIIRALSRGDWEGNRFLVGDLKQSIYRFRLADPSICQRYKSLWQSSRNSGTVIPLADNFRSRKGVLDFINPLFSELMREGIGGVGYDKDARLNFGKPEEREGLRTGVCVEVHLQITERSENGEAEEEELPEGSPLAELTNTEREARLIARRLTGLKKERYPIWDDSLKKFRPVEFKDMVILLRAPAYKAEAYAKEFTRAGIPLEADQGNFFDNAEITDLLSLLQLLDNPLQDIPTLAVLRSPIVGLSLDELAEIRLAAPHTSFWAALQRWHQVQSPTPRDRDASESKAQSHSLREERYYQKVDAFLGHFSKWRRMARETSLSQRLETVLQDTWYYEWLLTQPRGEQRQANVRRFLAMAQQFDPWQRQGLQRFLRYVDAQKEAEISSEPIARESSDAVQLLSIHRSKGLEYPVVVLADLGKDFNFQDLRERILLDNVYGLCPQVCPPQIRGHYPSLPYWLARLRQRREILGEELRLLYVAMTRARDLLLLVGTPSGKVKQKWEWATDRAATTHDLLSARRYLDWLGPWLTRECGDAAWLDQPEGSSELFHWKIHAEKDDSVARLEDVHEKPAQAIADKSLQLIQNRLEWAYTFLEATRQPAKASVSFLRNRVLEQSDEEAQSLFHVKGQRRVAEAAGRRLKSVGRRRNQARLSAAEIGVAHHLFLQMVSLARVHTLEQLRKEAGSLQEQGFLSDLQLQALDFKALLRFWNSEAGEKIVARSQHVHREIPFTARLSAEDLRELALLNTPDISEQEYLVVQGAVDLAVIMPEEIWVIDFKMEELNSGEVDRMSVYSAQVKLYALAMGRIYGRGVTQRWLHFLASGETVRI